MINQIGKPKEDKSNIIYIVNENFSISRNVITHHLKFFNNINFCYKIITDIYNLRALKRDSKILYLFTDEWSFNYIEKVKGNNLELRKYSNIKIISYDDNRMELDFESLFKHV